MTSLDEFCRTLSQLSGVVQNITDIEQRRVEAASQNQHHKIQSFLNEEQAALLSMRGLEQKRMQQADALGWKGLTFQQILETADDDQKKALHPLFAELSEKISLLKDIREGADRIINLRIRELEAAISKAGGLPRGTSSHIFQSKV